MDKIKFHNFKELKDYFADNHLDDNDAELLLRDPELDTLSKLIIAIEYNLDTNDFWKEVYNEDNISNIWEEDKVKTSAVREGFYSPVAYNLIKKNQIKLKDELTNENISVDSKLNLLKDLNKIPNKESFATAVKAREYYNTNQDCLEFLKQENQFSKIQSSVLEALSGKRIDEKLSIEEIAIYLEDAALRRALFSYNNLSQYIEAKNIVDSEVLDILRDELRAKLGLEQIFDDIAGRGELIGTLEEFSLMQVRLENPVQEELLKDFFRRKHYDASSLSLFQAALSIGLKPKVEISLKGDILVYKYHQKDSALIRSFFNSFDEKVYSILSSRPISRKDEVAMVAMFVGNKVQGAGNNPAQSLAQLLNSSTDNKREELLSHIDKSFKSLEEVASTMPKFPGYHSFALEKDDGKLLNLQAIVDDYRISLTENEKGEFLCSVTGGENSFSDVDLSSLFNKFTDNLNNYKELQ